LSFYPDKKLEKKNAQKGIKERQNKAGEVMNLVLPFYINYDFSQLF